MSNENTPVQTPEQPQDKPLEPHHDGFWDFHNKKKDEQ
jgi:hypothetical protein